MAPGQPRPGRRPPARANVVEADVESMEQRLAQLKQLMQEEKAKRESKRLPGGSNWRSAAHDGVGTGSRYVDKVLREGAKGGGGPQQARPGPRVTQRSESVASLAPAKSSHTGRVRKLREETHAQANTGRNGGSAATAAKVEDVVAAAEAVDASSSKADLAPGQTRDLSELFVWHPSEAVPGEAGAYEDLVAPSPRAHTERMKPATATEAELSANAASAGTGGGGSLLDADYDEEASAAEFQAALRAWRGEPEPASSTSTGAESNAKRGRETADEIWARAQAAAGMDSGGSGRAAAGDTGARPAGSKHAPAPTAAASAAAVGTQAGVRSMDQMSFYERLQEQKRRDGLL